MITCYIISVVILAQTIAALSSPTSAPTELANFIMASSWLSTAAAVHTTAELRIIVHEEKLWLELDELADEVIKRQIASLGFDRELRANCMANVDKAVQAYKLLRAISRSHGTSLAHTAIMRASRDLTLCYCLRQQFVPDRDTLLFMLNVAFEGEIDRDRNLRSQMLHSYHHIMGTTDEAFLSKTRLLVLRRGWTQPRAAKHASQLGCEEIDSDYAVVYESGVAKLRPLTTAPPSYQEASVGELVIIS